MSMYRASGAAVAATAFLITASAAQADITPGEAWQDWKDYMAAFGYEVTASEAMSGDTLTVRDVSMRIDAPEEDVAVSVTLGEMSFTGISDGSVAVTIPARLPVTMIVTGAEAYEVETSFDTVDFEMTVSGDPDDSRAVYSASSMKMALQDVAVEGMSLAEMPDGAPFRDVSIQMRDVTGVTTTTLGDARKMDQRISTGAWSYLVDVVDPENAQGSIRIEGGSESLKMTGVSVMPQGADMNDMSAKLKAGFAVDGGYEFGPGSMQFRFDEGGSVTEGRTTSQGGDMRVVMDQSRLTYGGGTNGLSFEIAGGDIPFPVAADMARYGFELMMPVMQSETPQDFGLEVVLADFTMSEFIWALFDPAGQLPRDPATIDVDLSGTARLFVDLLDTDQVEAVETEEAIPGELNSLSIDTLTVSAAGAVLTGTGAVEMDNEDLTTYDGFPKPVGTVSLNLSGANALLDTLVSLGFLPEEQAMGARMMMGLFAVAGDGPDELTSTIEFTDEGQIMANGQRLR